MEYFIAIIIYGVYLLIRYIVRGINDGFKKSGKMPPKDSLSARGRVEYNDTARNDRGRLAAKKASGEETKGARERKSAMLLRTPNVPAGAIAVSCQNCGKTCLISARESIQSYYCGCCGEDLEDTVTNA